MYKFVDLFAGLGGFHLALKSLGHQCVFACEKNENLALLYEENFGINPDRDIRDVEWEKVPKFDILCAGFPCQPFSKAGKQKGIEDERNLFDFIVKAIKVHKPSFFILENVKHLAKHNNEQTWNSMQEKLENELGYDIDKKIISPHHFNVPQHRERMFIVGAKEGLSHFQWQEEEKFVNRAFDFVSTNSIGIKNIEEKKKEVLDVWQEFIERVPKDKPIPGFPIWANEFGADYPFEKITPYVASDNLLGRKKGSFGVPLKGLSRGEKFNNLPSYAKRKQNVFPVWKQKFIKWNRDFYAENKKYIDPVLPKIAKLENHSWQKLEWNCQDGNRNLNDYIIQFRSSGVRIKKSDFFPSLVCPSTQIPIIGWEGRYLTKEEGAMLQSMEGIKLPENIGTCFKALGNAVNVKIVKIIASSLVGEFKKKETTEEEIYVTIT